MTDQKTGDPAGTGHKVNILVVANRLPVKRVSFDETERFNAEGGQTEQWATSPGGLVAALGPAMAEYDGAAWLGWTGEQTTKAPAPFVHDGLLLVPVGLSDEERELHYEGMSNGTIWPLYHDKVEPSEYHRTWFEGYRRINQRFADQAASVAAEGAAVWVQDYQLQLVPGMLRSVRPDLKIGFFLHIPFPAPELFFQLPWRREITRGLLGADLIGFQTPDDATNFERLAVKVHEADNQGPGTLSVEDQSDESDQPLTRSVQVKAFPIGIDNDRYADAAQSSEVLDQARDLRARLGQPQIVMLGVDRLDYTKGIDVRLRAFKELLAEGRVQASQVTMIQVAEPSRDQVDAYITLRERVEQLVGEINGSYSRVGFPVVHYMHQSQTFEEIMAMYRAADVMLVTPFRDGMNLVAKEYIASRFDESGCLVLSEFAGAAHQLTDALLVNPYDIEGLKNTIVRAVEMDSEESRTRMKALRRKVEHNNAGSWARSFLSHLAGD